MKARQLLPIYLLCAALAAAAYVFLSIQTEWTLFPYTKALELLFGFAFIYTDAAYEAIGSNVVITKACSGVNLFLSLYAILVLGFLHRFLEAKKRLLFSVLFFASSVLVAFLATLARIIVSLPFSESPHFKLIHTIISLCVFFGTGLLVYSITDKLLKGGHKIEEAV
ncbi:MAG: exosortase K [Oscillospiraceae bacterium]|nr:exosortase K [Oscillospiraceae bacterium]